MGANDNHRDVLPVYAKPKPSRPGFSYRGANRNRFYKRNPKGNTNDMCPYVEKPVDFLEYIRSSTESPAL